MPKRLFEQAQVTLNTFDISADISGAELMVGRRSPVDVTGLSDTYDAFLVPNLRRWSVRLPFFNNFDGTSMSPPGINVALKSVFNSTQSSGVTFILRSTTNARSVANPEWQGQVQIDGDFAATAGNVAEADKGTVSLKGLGVLSFFTSSS
jgi:hypothetical protein